MFILHLIPQSFINLAIMCTFGAGIALYIIGLAMNFWPPFTPYKEFVRILGTVLMALGVYFYGGYTNEVSWQQKVAEAQQKADQAVLEAKKVNKQIVYKIRYKQQVIKQNGKTVVQYIDREITKYDKSCVIPEEVIKAHNAAATNTPIESSK